jgi:gamma-glutamylcyclotransferase
MNELLYFAYGSNMSSSRLRHRVPSARPLETAILDGHRLAWHKKGADGSGKCDIVAGCADEVVCGVLYAFDPAHKPRLDHAEGLGRSYGLKYVDLRLPGRDEPVTAFTYYALRIDPARVPYDWYRDHVLIGALEHALPDHYISRIRSVPTIRDPDMRREAAERRLHEAGPRRPAWPAY